MDKEYLHLLIDEEIYLIEEDKAGEESAVVEVSEDTPPETNEKVEASKEHVDETPHIPKVKVERPIEQIIPFAVFHESTNEEEIALLQKIIDACKLNPNEYQVFANGFNKEVKFKKALVFVPTAKAFYEPIPYQKSEFLCAKPLNQIVGNQKEKAKLWKALQAFV